MNEAITKLIDKVPADKKDDFIASIAKAVTADEIIKVGKKFKINIDPEMAKKIEGGVQSVAKTDVSKALGGLKLPNFGKKD